jgi:hypothetical protein
MSMAAYISVNGGTTPLLASGGVTVIICPRVRRITDSIRVAGYLQRKFQFGLAHAVGGSALVLFHIRPTTRRQRRHQGRAKNVSLLRNPHRRVVHTRVVLYMECVSHTFTRRVVQKGPYRPGAYRAPVQPVGCRIRVCHGLVGAVL